jgi:hypothetical protein
LHNEKMRSDAFHHFSVFSRRRIESLMGIDPAILRAMQAAGCTTEQIIAVVEADAAADEARKEQKRENNRERQRRWRESRNADNALQALSDVTDCDTRDDPTLDKKAPDPKKLIPSLCVNNSSSRARGGYHRLPEGWVPTRPIPPNIQAKVDEWPPGALDSELAALHRWAVNAKNEDGKGRKRDWDRAWWNWIERRHDERYGRQGTNGVGRSGTAADGLSSTARAAISVFGAQQ